MTRSASDPTLATVDSAALEKLIDGHHSRMVRPGASRTVAGHLVKPYVIEAPGRTVTEEDLRTGFEVAHAHLASAQLRGSVGLTVLIFHAGGDGDYLLVDTWIEGHMTDLAVFTGPPGKPDELRPGRAGVAPCVWEAAVLAHERDSFSRHVLDGHGDIEQRLAAWREDVVAGEVR